MRTRHDVLMDDAEYQRLSAIEGLVTDAAEMVARLMKKRRANKAELARRLGKSRAWVTRFLSGEKMTIRTLAEVSYALGAEIKLHPQSRVGVPPK